MHSDSEIAIVATTFTICAVFIPVAFMGGIPGEFFRPFGFTVTVAVLFSLLVARTLTPMMAAYILKPAKPHEQKDGPLMRRYMRTMQWCLRNRLLTAIAAGVFFAAQRLMIRSTSISPLAAGRSRRWSSSSSEGTSA